MKKSFLAYVPERLRNQPVHRITGCTILLVSMYAFCIMPFMMELPRAGHDIGFHLGRISAIAQQLSQGILYSKINYWFGNGLGYAASLGYPDMFLYIPAMLMYCGMDIASAYQNFMLFCSFATFLAMYAALRSCQVSRDAAFLGAVLYSISPYHIYCMVVRAAVGEILSFIFYPLIAAGAYSCISDKGKHGCLLCIGFAGMALSHALSLVTAVFFFSVYMLINIKKFMENIKVIVVNIAVAAGLSAYFWLPLIEFYLTNDLYMHHALSTTYVFASELKYLFIPSLLPDKLFFGFPIYLVSFFLLYRQDIPVGHLKLFGIAVVILLCTTTLFPFWGMKALSFIQFPWRLFGIISLFMTFAFAFFAERFFSEKRYERPCCVALTFFLSSAILMIYIAFTTIPYHSGNISNTDFGAGSEFLPYNARKHSYTKEDVWAFVKENKSIDLTKQKLANFSKNPSTEHIQYRHYTTQADILVPNRIYIDTVHTRLLYYTGYKVYAYDSNGEVFSPAVVENTDDGFCKILLNREFKGVLVIKYESSPVQILSYIITAATVLFLLIQGFKMLKRKYLSTMQAWSL